MLALLLPSALLGNGPDVFPVIKDLFVFDVISRVDGRLRAKQQFGITYVSPQEVGHLARRGKERGKHLLIGLNQWISGIEHVEMYCAVIRIHNRFDTVANVIHSVISEIDMAGEGIAIGGSEAVDDPIQGAVITDDNVRIIVESQERSHFGDTLANIPPHQQHAVCGNIVREWNLREITDAPRQQQPSKE